jgi:hypothetical protein
MPRRRHSGPERALSDWSTSTTLAQRMMSRSSGSIQDGRRSIHHILLAASQITGCTYECLLSPTICLPNHVRGSSKISIVVGPGPRPSQSEWKRQVVVTQLAPTSPPLPETQCQKNATHFLLSSFAKPQWIETQPESVTESTFVWYFSCRARATTACMFDFIEAPFVFCRMLTMWHSQVITFERTDKAALLIRWLSAG